MKVITQDVEFDMFNNQNFLNKEIIDILKSKGRIYLIPKSLHNHILEKIENDYTLNNLEYWCSCLNLYTSILNGMNSSKYLKTIKYNYNIIINEWREDNILKQNRGNYDTETGKTFEYKFEETNKYCFLSLLLDDEYEVENNIGVKLDRYYKNTLLNCTIDIPKSIYDEYINLESMELFVKRVNLIFKFLSRRYIKKGNKVDRWYNSFSSLTSISRKYVMLDGKYFYEMDLANAQPSLLCKYLMDIYGNDFDLNYINDTSSGRFYERLMECAIEMNIDGEWSWDKDLKLMTYKRFCNRKDVKKLCYQNIFFDQKIETKVFQIFNKLYPNTWRLINLELNSDETLAKKLQNLEADIFLNIKPKCNYFTVHDAIYINDPSFKEYIENKMEKLMKTNLFKLTSDFDKQDSQRIDYDVRIEKEGKNTIFLIESLNKQHKQHKQHKSSNKDKIIELQLKGLNQQEIIKELGISRKTYYKYKQ